MTKQEIECVAQIGKLLDNVMLLRDDENESNIQAMTLAKQGIRILLLETESKEYDDE